MALVASTTPQMNALADTWRLSPSLLKRLPLVLVAVVLCYQFNWGSLRYLTSEVALRFAELRGFPAQRLGPDVISWNGGLYQFGIACTFADVFCGAVPLVWVSGAARNVRNIVGLAAALFVFNLIRRCLTDLVFSAGVPWFVADQAIGGAAYFTVWVCLLRWLELHEGLSEELDRAVLADSVRLSPAPDIRTDIDEPRERIPARLSRFSNHRARP